LSRLSKYLFALLLCLQAQAEDKEIDQSIGTIHKIDMSDDKPKGPTYILVSLDLKRLKVSGAHGHSIVRQFTKRSRIEFEGSGLPKGKYALGVASSCKSAITDLHQFEVTSTHVSTEKSLPKAALREPGNGLLVLEGKFLIFSRFVKGKFEAVDCKAISG